MKVKGLLDDLVAIVTDDQIECLIRSGEREFELLVNNKAVVVIRYEGEQDKELNYTFYEWKVWVEDIPLSLSYVDTWRVRRFMRWQYKYNCQQETKRGMKRGKELLQPMLQQAERSGDR